ncbi:MAG: LacI family DNA-binding transcriptional regulator [Solobacterium sp.]|nr:LacI family DNA-binding transcriptional regulator [Solobacterium sp.]MDO4194137.1 LacI family DNA-binding transcriptional regulator [Erysipelotrichaceae bacterium]
MTSIKDIAKELNLAVSTVSMALNDNEKISKETRRLVHEKAKEMKYVRNGAAVDLQKQKTNLILFVLYDASRSFFSYTIKSLQIATAELGYDFLISTTYGGHRNTAERFIKERRADAVIVYTKTISDELLTQYASADFPVFVLGHDAVTDNPYVKSFLAPEVRPLLTCEYLIEKGHRRIGFVTGFAESFGTVRSMNGFRLSMSRHGLPVDESLIFDAGGSQMEDGYNVAEKQILSRLDDMDGLIFSNDDIAVGAMKCFNDHNIVIPDRISVIGQHNIPASATTMPPLTTLTSTSGQELFSKLVKCLDSYIRMEPDLELEKELQSHQSEQMIVERQTVKDLNKR